MVLYDVLCGHVSLLDMAEKENVFEKQPKKSTSRARLMISSCCVLMEGLLKIFCKVRGVTPILSASHSFVWPCRRNSSRIREPICIGMVVCYLCEVLPIPQIPSTTKKEANNFVSNVRSWKLPFEDRQNARL